MAGVLGPNPSTVDLANDTLPVTVFKGSCKVKNITWSGYTAAPTIFPKITDGNGKFIVQFNVDTATDVEEKRTGPTGYHTGLIVTTTTGAASTGFISIFFE